MPGGPLEVGHGVSYLSIAIPVRGMGPPYCTWGAGRWPRGADQAVTYQKNRPSSTYPLSSYMYEVG